MTWLLNRLKERSTWSGIIVLAGIAGYSLDPKQQELVVTLGTTLVALIFTFTSDPKIVVAKNEPANEPQTIVTPDLTATQRAEMGLD